MPEPQPGQDLSALMRELLNTDQLPAETKEKKWILSDNNLVLSFPSNEDAEELKLMWDIIQLEDISSKQGHEYGVEESKEALQEDLLFASRLNRAKLGKTGINERIAEITSNSNQVIQNNPIPGGEGFFSTIKSLVIGGK